MEDLFILTGCPQSQKWTGELEKVMGWAYKKRELRKNICYRFGADAPNGSPASVKMKRGINKKAA